MSVGFNRVAPFYDLLARFVYGSSIRDAQIRFLSHVNPNSKVLILGGGTGWLLEELAKFRTNISVDYVEHSEKMLLSSKSRKQFPFNQLRFILGTEEQVNNETYDFIITAFVLDVFPQEEMESMVFRVRNLLSSQGQWLCVDFDKADRSFKAKVLSFVMIQFFRILSGLKTKGVLDYFGQIKKNGGREIDSAKFYGEFIKASLFRMD
jgi:tRNA (cmo5U34)-methyltransferase